MSVEKAEALRQIDAVLARRQELPPAYQRDNVQEITTLLCALIKRLAPPNAGYHEQMEKILSVANQGTRWITEQTIMEGLIGVVRALRADYEDGRVMTAAKSDIPAFLQIEKLLLRFHRVAQQLTKRRESRPTLLINDEYDVQDLFRALLWIEFDDVRPEQWTPSYAGGSAKMDFLLKKEQVVIEVKKTRATLGEKEVRRTANH
jgi:hypothetical protein